MKSTSLTTLFSAICLSMAMIPISRLSAADDPLDWVRPAVPAPDADGWITLFDGAKLHGCSTDQIRSRAGKIGLSEGCIWLDNAWVSFDVSARNVDFRAVVKKVSGQNATISCRVSGGRRYSAWFNGRGSMPGDFGLGVSRPQWEDLNVAKASRDFGDFFQLGMLAEDRVLTLMADEKVIASIESDVINEAGTISISALRGRSLFKKIQVKILDAPPPPPSWTNTEGKTIQAEFIRLEGESVVVRKDGSELPIPFAKLSLASRNQARELAAGNSVAGTPAASVPAPIAAAPGIPDHPAIPKPGAWKSANASGLPKSGKDRAFLVDRGWVEGRLVAVDGSSVTMQAGNETFRVPRKQVSLLGLSDAYTPEKRNGGQEVRLRVVMEGPAECATLHFKHGAVIKEVLKKPTWAEGADGDDKAFTGSTTISFEKGADQSINRLETEIVLLLPKEGSLACEVNNNRSNGFSGPLTFQFFDSADGRLIAELTPPDDGNHGMWYGFEIDREKLLKPTRVQKLSPAPVKFERSRIPALSLLNTQPSRPRPGAAKLVFLEEPARHVVLDSINNSEVILADPQRTRIPRERLVWIELLDWQLDSQQSTSQTPPVRWVSYGISTAHRITLPAKTTFSSLIVPPYCLYGIDSDDSFRVKDERIFECHKGAMDQSSFHMEMVAAMALPPDADVEFQINNAYTNVWAGHWEFVLLQSLSNRRIMDFKSSEGELDTARKVQRIKLMEP